MKAAIKTMLAQWNTAITALRPRLTADAPAQLAPYGADFTPAELPPIRALDLPAGIPSWTNGEDGWAKRVGAAAADKRRTLQIVVPDGVI